MEARRRTRSNRLRRAVVALVVVTAALVASAGILYAKSSTTHLFVAPDGLDAWTCTPRLPCRSLDRAYERASPGAVIELAEGVYPGQTITESKKSSTRRIVIRPAPGARVSFTGRLTIEGADHLVLENLQLASGLGPSRDRSLVVAACTTDVTFRNVRGETFFIMEGTRKIAFRGGRWGGYSTPGQQDSAIGTNGAAGPTRLCGGRLAPPASEILFDRVTFHDVFWKTTRQEWGPSHPDCLEINGYANGVTIRRSSFLRCGGDAFFAVYGDQGDVLNVIVENTRFVGLGDFTWYGINLASTGKPYKCGSIVFRNNVYRPDNPKALAPYSPIRTECEAPPNTLPVAIVHNVFQRGPSSWSCAIYRRAPYNTIWDSNRFELASPCGSNAKVGRKP
jgi:hypothetical protein